MNDPNWTVILSAIGSVIGMVTGVVGAWTGISSSRKVHKMTVLDLRMKYGDLYSTVQVQLDSIKELAPKANQSRINRFAAQGLYKSGLMEKWNTDYNNYANQIDTLSLEFRGFSDNSTLFNSEKLASDILGITLIQKRIQVVNDNLKQSIAEDDNAREHLRKVKTRA